MAITQQQGQFPVVKFLESELLSPAHLHCIYSFITSLDFEFFQTLAQHLWTLRSGPECQAPCAYTSIQQGRAQSMPGEAVLPPGTRTQQGCSGAIKAADSSLSDLPLWKVLVQFSGWTLTIMTSSSGNFFRGKK